MAVSVGEAVGYLDLDITGFLSNLQKANSEADKASKTLSNTLGDGLQTVGNKVAGAGKVMTAAITTPIIGAGTAAVKTAANFDSAMSKVSAISGATGKDFDSLREKALEMGSKTKFSASEAADAMSYMAMAGWKTEDMIGGIDGIMNLAAASGEDLALTSDIVTDALTAFGLQASDAGHFADVLAAASSNANTNVSMMGESFKYVGPVAGALGYSVEDVSVALGLMANSGIKSSQAGTTLRTLLSNMAKPTDEVAASMEKLGVRLDDGQGNMLSFREIMDQLRGSFGDLRISQEDLEREMAALDAKLESGEIKESEYNESVQALMESAYGAEGALKAQEAAALAGTRGMSGLLAIVNASEEDYNKLVGAIDSASFSLDDISAALENNGVQWEKYSDKAWQKTGEGIKGLADEIIYNLNEVGTSAEDLQQYLMFEYDLDAEDAKAAIESVQKSLEESTGTAENMAKVMQDNLAGRITELKSALEGLSIQIGTIIIPYVEKFVAKAKELVAWFSSLSEEQQKNIIKWAAIAAAIGPILLVFGKLIVGIGSLIKSFAEIKTAITGIKEGFVLFKTAAEGALAGITAPIAAIIALIGLLIAAFVTLWQNNEEFREKITAILEQLKETFSALVEGITERLSALKPIFDEVVNALSVVWNGFCELLAPIFIAALELVQETFKLISDAIIAALDFFIGIFTGNWEQAWQGVKEFFIGIWNFIKAFLISIVNALKGIADAFLKWFGTNWQEVWTKTRTFVENTLNKTKTFVLNVFGSINKIISEKINNAKETLSNVLDGIHEKFTSIFDDAKRIVSDALDHIKGLFNFEWHLPELKLPHINVGGYIDVPVLGTIPDPRELSIEWYKKAMSRGMILNAATVFGFDKKSGKLLGGGEAGSETIVGTQSLLQMIGKSVNNAMLNMAGVLKSEVISGMTDILYNNQNGIIDIEQLAKRMSEIIHDMPVVNNVTLEMEDGNVYMDSERVGRKLAPVISRLQT